MNFIETHIPEVFVIEPKIFGDSRGYFCETFKQSEFEKHIGKINFIQDNESMSSYGVLRGLHYQRGEFAQAKLVRVVKGAVLDVAVDNETIFNYKVDNLYSPENEAGIMFDDPTIGIDWRIPQSDIKLSDKDKLLGALTRL